MQRAVYLIAYPFIYLIASIPFNILYVFSDFLRLLIYNLLGYRKKIVRSNLIKAFPHKSEDDLKWIEKRFYKHFCDITLEAFKSLTISSEEMQKRMVFKNLDVLTQFEKGNRSVIIMCGHYASWEWMLSIGYHTVSQGYGIYTPIMNKYLNKLIIKIRKKHRGNLISRYSAIQQIKNLHNEGNIAVYGFVSDQSPRPKPKSYWRPFLGVKVPVFVGAEMVARELDFGVVYAKINRVKRGYYEASFELISDQPKKTKLNRITDTFTEWLEQDIYSDPTQYLWTHKRFKHADKAPQD
ncbi:MAG: lysophospholipid acyltransferase family protein [Bacteroidota bacterium]|nr:lysophospholipid acyltransferase family protein [Bacteroidota bacterium]MEC9135234.1 lysophospholipid acyltransferase family protein [Bacteroidota bacterium]